jgi:hypothetical protein
MKKIILLVALSLILSNLTFSQNVLFLKNGDKINGKFEGIKNDTIIFKIQGNILKLKTLDIISIYFDAKHAPIELSKTTKTSEVIPALQGSVSGVVTYFFNKNYGDKPDVGAQIFIVDIMKTPDFDLEKVNSFYYASFYKSIYLEYKSMGVAVPNDIMEKVKKYNIDDKLAFDSFDNSVKNNLSKIELAEDVIKTVVDGSGNYSVKIKPGTYYIYIKSNNRTGISMTEIFGKVNCQKVIVKDGMDTNISHNFKLR